MFTKLRRWVIWSLGLLALLLVILAIGIGWYTRTEQFNSLLRSRILAILNDSLNAEVKFSRITGTVWHEVEIHDLALVQDGQTVFSTPRVMIEVGLLGQLYALLSSSGLRVARIDIALPQLRLVQDQEKNWNVMKLIKKSDSTTESQSLNIFLDNITLTNGTIRVHIADGTESRLTALSGEGALSLLAANVQARL